MDYTVIGVLTPILIIALYIVWEMVKYNPENPNTTIPLEDEEDTRLDD